MGLMDFLKGKKKSMSLEDNVAFKGLVRKEMYEHPQLSEEEAEQLVLDHLRSRRMKLKGVD